MLDERELTDRLHELVDDVRPRTGLADDVITRRRASRRHAGGLAGATGAAAAVAAGVALASGGLGGGTASPAHLRLAGYRFRLPHDATPVAKTPAACALGSFIAEPVAPNGTVAAGTSPAGEPGIANAVIASGGCVSMTITTPYTPGTQNEPQPAFPEIDTNPITIDGDTGTIGEQEFEGGSDVTINGVHVANGTTGDALALHLPAAGGQVRLLFVTAAGISQAELQQIVASGLSDG